MHAAAASAGTANRALVHGNGGGGACRPGLGGQLAQPWCQPVGVLQGACRRATLALWAGREKGWGRELRLLSAGRCTVQERMGWNGGAGGAGCDIVGHAPPFGMHCDCAQGGVGGGA